MVAVEDATLDGICRSDINNRNKRGWVPACSRSLLLMEVEQDHLGQAILFIKVTVTQSTG